MMRLLGLFCGAAIVCGAVLIAQDATRSATFRARRDLQLLDVTVTAGREPVRGLIAADFTVTVDGRPATIVGVQAIAVRPPTPASIAERSLLPDVVSNQLDTKRVVVVFIDDFSLLVSGELSAGAVQQTREIARDIVTGLGPEEQSAVLFSLSDRRTQTLTTSTALLLEAIDHAPLFTSSNPSVPLGECACSLCSYHALRAVAEALRTLAGLRKTIMYVGPGLIPPSSNDRVCAPRQAEALQDTLDAARLANVTINTFDPRGLKPRLVSRIVTPDYAPTSAFRAEMSDPRLEFLRNLASSTGGRAIINTNAPADHVADVLADGRAYYLLGVMHPAEEARDRDDKPPRIQVRVTRRGAKVSVRSGFRPLDAAAARLPGGSPDGAEAGGLEAMTRALLPDAEVPMEVTASPFAGPDGKPVVSVVLGVLDDRGIQASGQPVDLFVRVLDRRGQEVTTHRERAAMPAAAAGERYAFQSVIPLPPGRYELRAAARSEAFGEGSVYTHVDVPDFRGADLSATSLMLTDANALAPATPAAPVPVFPLTRRKFSHDDRVAAFLRVYQRPASGAAPSVSMRVVKRDGAQVREASLPVLREQVEPAPGPVRAIDYAVSLPLASLVPDEYVMRVRIDAGRTPIERTVRFRVD